MAGEVTALKAQKKNRDRVSVYLDGRFAFGLPAIVAASLRLGQHLSDPEIESLKEQGNVEKEYNQALNYLSYRPRSQAEVSTYLQKRGVPEIQIDIILDRLENVGLVDDAAFARYWVDNRERFRPRGLRGLRYELQTKGIDNEVIDEALASVDPSASAYRAAGKKAQQLRNLEESVFERRLVEYLARRGFAYDIAQEVARRHWQVLMAEE
jgi:regulatory protein